MGTPRVTSGTKSTATATPMKSNTLDLTGSYVSILSSNPPDPIQTSTALVDNESSTRTQSNQNQDLRSASSVWKHAMELAGAGQTEEAAKFFRIHEAMSLAKKSNETTIETSKPTNATNTQEEESTSLVQTKEVFSEGGITFIPGAVTTHMDIGFTPYFDKKL